MKTMKKFLIPALAFGVLLGVYPFSTPYANASKYSNYVATTKKPLKYQLLYPNGNKFKLPSAAEAKSFKDSHNAPSAIIKAGTKIIFYNDPVFKKGKDTYYRVGFKSKKYQNLAVSDKGIFPSIKINNFNQLKDMHKTKEIF